MRFNPVLEGTRVLGNWAFLGMRVCKATSTSSPKNLEHRNVQPNSHSNKTLRL